MKKPIGVPYLKLKAYCEAQGEVSLRKQVCLQFLKWGYTVLKKDKTAFIELIKRWRSEENRVGLPRTLLERKARKFFREHANHKKRAPSREGAKEWCKKSREKKIGVHTDEYQANLREHNKRIRQIQIEKGLTPNTLDWIVYSPTGEVFRVRGLVRFCEERGFSDSHLGNTHRNPGSLYKGWRAEKVSEDRENF